METSKSKANAQSKNFEVKQARQESLQLGEQTNWSSERAATLRTAAKARHPGACDCNCACCGD